MSALDGASAIAFDVAPIDDLACVTFHVLARMMKSNCMLIVPQIELICCSEDPSMSGPVLSAL